MPDSNVFYVAVFFSNGADGFFETRWKSLLVCLEFQPAAFKLTFSWVILNLND